MSFDISKKIIKDEGNWTKLEGFGDAEWHIVCASDRSVRAGRQKIITRDYGRKSAKGNMTANDNIDLGLKTTAEFILTGWRNIVEGGKEVEYSPKQAFTYLESVKGLLEEVNDYALNEENYLQSEVVAKKSGSTSANTKD